MLDNPTGLRRRIYMTWVLVFGLLFTQLTWVCGPAAASPSDSAPFSATSRRHAFARNQLSALPAWFDATPSQVASVTTQEAFSPPLFDPGASLPDWFGNTARPQLAFQPSMPSLSKSASVITASLEQVFTYTLVFTVPARQTLTNVSIEDNLPDDADERKYPEVRLNGTFGNYAGPIAVTGGTPDIDPGDVSVSSNNPQHISWDLPDINNVSFEPYVYRITFQAAARYAVFRTGLREIGTNEAIFSWDGGSASAGVDVAIVLPDLRSHQIVESPEEVASDPSPPDSTLGGLRAGDIITVHQLLTNSVETYAGVNPIYNMVVSYQLPLWLTFVDMVSSHADPDSVVGGSGLNAYTELGWHAASLGGQVSDLNRLDPGDGVSIVFRARVNDDVAAGRRNDGNMLLRWYYYPTGNEQKSGFDPNFDREVSLGSAVPTIVKQVDEPDDLQVWIFDPITYTIIITMPGPGVTLYNTPTIQLRDTLYDGLSYVTALNTPVGWTAPVTQFNLNNTRITWDWQGGDIVGSGTYIFRFLARDDGFYRRNGTAVDQGEALENEAELLWGNHDSDLAGYDFSIDDSISVIHVRPQIEPDKSVSPGVITSAGQQVVWTIDRVRNQTSYGATAWDIVLTDTLPPGFGLVGAYPPGYSTTTVGNSIVITWGTYPSLTVGGYLPSSPPNDFYLITSTAPVTLPFGQTYYNHATLHYSDQPEGQPGRQSYLYTATADVGVDVELLQRFKYVAPSSDLRIGDSVRYTASVRLPAGGIAFWPRFDDPLPLGVQYISPTIEMQGASVLTLTLGADLIFYPNRQIVKWEANTLSNPTSLPLYFTTTFEARVTGVDIYDTLRFDSANEMRDSVSLVNQYEASWNFTNRPGDPRDTKDPILNLDLFSNPAGTFVNQPFLVDRDPVKSLVSPAAGTPVQGGDLVTYSLVVYNTGLAPAYDVIISDTLPPGVLFRSYQARVYPYGAASFAAAVSSAPVDGQEGVIGWVFDEIAAGDGNTADPTTRLAITYTVEVTGSVGAGAALANSFWISDYTSLPGPAPFERHYAGVAAGVGEPTSGPVLYASSASISKTSNITQVPLGGIVVFTLTVPAQPLGATMYNVTVTDNMPTAPRPLQVLSADAPEADNFTFTGDTVSAAYNTIPNNTQATIIITARVPITSYGGITQNEASVTWEDAASGGSPHSATTAPLELLIIAPELQLNKSAPAVTSPGFPIMYTLRYENAGKDLAENVRLTDTLPASVTYAGVDYDRVVTQTGFVPGPLVWDLGNLVPGEGGTIWLTVTVWSTAPLGSRLVNTCEISTTSRGDDPSNNQDEVTTTIANAVLGITKMATPDPVEAGDQIVYTLFASNSGVEASQNLIVTDRVPLSTTFVNASPEGSLTGDVVTWRPSDIGPGEQAVVTFAVQVDSPLLSGTKIVNKQYGVGADNAPFINALAPVTVTVHSLPILSIAKTSATSAKQGEYLVYTIRYQNTGNAIANGVRITESYDANVAFVAADPPPDQGDNVWDVGAVSPEGGVSTIVITTQVDSLVANGTVLTNTVFIASEDTETQSATFNTFVGSYDTFMPVVYKDFKPAPPPVKVNLIVQKIEVEPVSPTVGQATVITVTLYNSGTNPVTDDFWVDLYVNPSTTPTVNVVWNDIAPYGKAWFVHDDIPAGGTLVIDTTQPDDLDNPDAVYSNWPGWFVSVGEQVLYVQVDSYGLATGLVVEDDETDNVRGPLVVIVGAGNADSTLTAPAPPVQWQERR